MLVAAQTFCLVRDVDGGEFEPRIGAFIDAVPADLRSADDLAAADDAGDEFPQAETAAR
jgi:hypothetical protein